MKRTAEEMSKRTVFYTKRLVLDATLNRLKQEFIRGGFYITQTPTNGTDKKNFGHIRTTTSRQYLFGIKLQSSDTDLFSGEFKISHDDLNKKKLEMQQMRELGQEMQKIWKKTRQVPKNKEYNKLFEKYLIFNEKISFGIEQSKEKVLFIFNSDERNMKRDMEIGGFDQLRKANEDRVPIIFIENECEEPLNETECEYYENLQTFFDSSEYGKKLQKLYNNTKSKY